MNCGILPLLRYMFALYSEKNIGQYLFRPNFTYFFLFFKSATSKIKFTAGNVSE